MESNLNRIIRESAKLKLCGQLSKYTNVMKGEQTFTFGAAPSSSPSHRIPARTASLIAASTLQDGSTVGLRWTPRQDRWATTCATRRRWATTSRPRPTSWPVLPGARCSWPAQWCTRVTRTPGRSPLPAPPAIRWSWGPTMPGPVRSGWMACGRWSRVTWRRWTSAIRRRFLRGNCSPPPMPWFQRAKLCFSRNNGNCTVIRS